MQRALQIFTGNANVGLAEKIAQIMERPLGDLSVTRFSEGEIFVKINEDVRGRDVFIIQPTCPPPNENFMELLIMIDAFKRASAARITAVVPFFGYARQDRKDQPRVPITAKLAANLITAAGADRVLTMDLHAGQIQGFFDIPVDHLLACPVFVEAIRKMDIANPVVVSPDVGGIKRARELANRLGADLAIVDKRRDNDKETSVMNILGNVKGHDAIITDDMVATAGSITEAAKVLKEKGANKIYIAISHPILSGPAYDRIRNSPIDKLLVTDSIPLNAVPDDIRDRIQVLSVSNLLAEAITRIHLNQSVSSLFK